MKKVFLFVLIAGSIQAANAQIDLGKAANKVTGAATNAVSAGSMLSQLAKGIAPASFTSKWATAKSGWLGSASKVVSAGQGAQLLGQLAGYIKPSAFKPSWGSAKSGFISGLGSVATMSSLGSSVKTLVGGMNNNAFTNTFRNNKSSFLTALNLLK